MSNLKNVIYLSNEDYETLVSTGTVTISGTTLTYDENNVYITPEKLASQSEDGLMSAADKVKLDTNAALLDATQTFTGVNTFSSGILFDTNMGIKKSGTALLLQNGNGVYPIQIYPSEVLFQRKPIPSSTNSIDLGSSTNAWKDLYLSGNLSDGTNSVSIANIAKTNADNNFSTNQTFKQPIKFESSSTGYGTILDANNDRGSFSFKAYNTSNSWEVFGYDYYGGVIHFEDDGANGYLALPHVGNSSSAVQLATVNDINNATLTIQQNGTSKGTFTANASSNSTINIITPQIEDWR